MKQFSRKHPYWVVVAVAVALASFYWTFWATDRYVSEANVVLQSAQPIAPSLNINSILKGGSSHELLMLRDHLLSVDMLQKLDGALNLRAHYADKDIDYLSRLRSVDVPLEKLHDYYLGRISVELDEYAQVLRVQVQAYDAEMAKDISAQLLAEGEEHMNAMGQRLAEEQVVFIERQVQSLNDKVVLAREALLAYQNEHGLVSPSGTVEGLSAIVATLEGELAKLSAQRHALSLSRSEKSPEIIRLDAQIRAIRNQIAGEQARMAGSTETSLNTVSAGFEALRLQLEFAVNMYRSAMAALETTRVEAARTLQQVSVLQQPTRPEYSTAPRRLYNSTVTLILGLLAGLVIHLLAAIVRDHRD